MFRKHNNTESFTVHEKDHSHYIRTVMKTCSNPNNIGFRNKDSLLIQTHCISKPSNAYSFQDRYTQRIIYFTYCLAPYFLNRLVTSYFFCQEVYFTFFFSKNAKKSCLELFVTIVGLQCQIAFLHTHSEYLLALSAEISPDPSVHKALQTLPQRSIQYGFLQNCYPHRTRLIKPGTSTNLTVLRSTHWIRLFFFFLINK